MSSQRTRSDSNCPDWPLRRVRVVTDTKVLTAGPGAAGGRRPAMWSPGEVLAIDWGTEVVAGRRVHVFHALLAWSRCRFGLLFPLELDRDPWSDGLVGLNVCAVAWWAEVNSRRHSEIHAIPAERLVTEPGPPSSSWSEPQPSA